MSKRSSSEVFVDNQQIVALFAKNPLLALTANCLYEAFPKMERSLINSSLQILTKEGILEVVDVDKESKQYLKANKAGSRVRFMYKLSKMVLSSLKVDDKQNHQEGNRVVDLSNFKIIKSARAGIKSTKYPGRMIRSVVAEISTNRTKTKTPDEIYCINLDFTDTAEAIETLSKMAIVQHDDGNVSLVFIGQAEFTAVAEALRIALVDNSWYNKR